MQQIDKSRKSHKQKCEHYHGWRVILFGLVPSLLELAASGCDKDSGRNQRYEIAAAADGDQACQIDGKSSKRFRCLSAVAARMPLIARCCKSRRKPRNLECSPLFSAMAIESRILLRWICPCPHLPQVSWSYSRSNRNSPAACNDDQARGLTRPPPS